MLVKNWMSKEIITVDVNDSMENAVKLLKENKIRLLPVMDKSRLVGIITDRDLKKYSASEATSLDIHELLYLLSRIKIRQIMTKNPITVPPDYTVEETACLLLENKISGVPVVDQQSKVLGVITQSDLFKVLISLTGISKRGVQFALLVEDRPGSIKEIADIIRKYDGRMVSILSSYERAQAGYRHLYIRAYQINRDLLQDLLKELKAAATLRYVVDHREDKRQVFFE